MDSHTHRNEEADEYPCQANYDIGDVMSVRPDIPENNYKSMDRNSLGNNRANSI
jgi:hypothetical protein